MTNLVAIKAKGQQLTAKGKAIANIDHPAFASTCCTPKMWPSNEQAYLAFLTDSE